MSIDDSRLVHLADEAQRPTRWWLAWVVAVVLIVLVGPLGVTAGNLALGDPASTSAWFPLVPACGSLAVLLGLLLWVRLKERRPFSTLGFRPRRQAARLLLGFGIGGAIVSAGVLVGLSTGLLAAGQSTHTRTGAEAILPLLPLVLLGLLQGVTQEAVARGYLLQMTVRELPAWVAVVGTSALVTVLQTFNPVSVLNALLYAAFASLVALQQGSLWLVAGMQAGWSFFQSSVFGLPVGATTGADALWSLGPAPGGSALVSGGYFGLDTGLLGTVLVAAATVVAYTRLRRATRQPSLEAGPAARRQEVVTL